MKPFESPDIKKSLTFFTVIILPFLWASIYYNPLVDRFHPLYMPLSNPITKKS